MFPGGLLSLGREDYSVGGDSPIGSCVKGESWGWGGVKEDDEDE